ncbi:hypothetical protein [Nitrobacter sp.]|uniref:hypothetical protein n=1 Tax=Nitrobacter sp. TaxID=29420 RepID=UPI00399D67B5
MKPNGAPMAAAPSKTEAFMLASPSPDIFVADVERLPGTGIEQDIELVLRPIEGDGRNPRRTSSLELFQL